MPSAVKEIERILQKQNSEYSEILKLEESKGDAIIAKSGKLIQETSVKQEKLLKNVEYLEMERLALISRFFPELAGDNDAKSVTLKDIAASLDSESSKGILKYGSELKALLLKVKAKQETNSAMLKDNIEYFDILISGLKNSSTLKSGYDRDGKEDERIINPVLFNQKA